MSKRPASPLSSTRSTRRRLDSEPLPAPIPLRLLTLPDDAQQCISTFLGSEVLNLPAVSKSSDWNNNFKFDPSHPFILTPRILVEFAILLATVFKSNPQYDIDQRAKLLLKRIGTRREISIYTDIDLYNTVDLFNVLDPPRCPHRSGGYKQYVSGNHTNFVYAPCGYRHPDNPVELSMISWLHMQWLRTAIIAFASVTKPTTLKVTAADTYWGYDPDEEVGTAILEELGCFTEVTKRTRRTRPETPHQRNEAVADLLATFYEHSRSIESFHCSTLYDHINGIIGILLDNNQRLETIQLTCSSHHLTANTIVSLLGHERVYRSLKCLYTSGNYKLIDFATCIAIPGVFPNLEALVLTGSSLFNKKTKETADDLIQYTCADLASLKLLWVSGYNTSVSVMAPLYQYNRLTKLESLCLGSCKLTKAEAIMIKNEIPTLKEFTHSNPDPHRVGPFRTHYFDLSGVQRPSPRIRDANSS